MIIQHRDAKTVAMANLLILAAVISLIVPFVCVVTDVIATSFRGHVQTITGKINVIVTLSSDPPSPRLNVII